MAFTRSAVRSRYGPQRTRFRWIIKNRGVASAARAFDFCMKWWAAPDLHALKEKGEHTSCSLFLLSFFVLLWRGGSNSRPLGPEPSALAGLSHAPYFVMLFWLRGAHQYTNDCPICQRNEAAQKILHFVLDKFLPIVYIPP